MTQSIAERMPEQTAALAKAGFPNIAALAQCHVKYSDMDKALGYQNAVHHWFNGRNGPTKAAEKTAGYILKAMNGSAPDVKAPKQQPERGITDGLFMVVCPTDKTTKVKRVLEMMGCEVEAI